MQISLTIVLLQRYPEVPRHLFIGQPSPILSEQPTGGKDLNSALTKLFTISVGEMLVTKKLNF